MKITLTDFYIAFSAACFSLLSLWFVIINFNARAWLNSHGQWQAYAVALYFAAPGTMSLLALVFEPSTLAWRIIFIIVSAFGALELHLFGPLRQARGPLKRSDYLVHWAAYALYAAIAVLAFIPNTLKAEGVLLTVLMLLGVHVALRLMFYVGHPRDTDAQVDAETVLPVLPVLPVRRGHPGRDLAPRAEAELVEDAADVAVDRALGYVADGLLHSAARQGGPDGPERTPRGRKGHAGHRPDIPAERDRRGDPLPRAGTRHGKVVITL